MSLKVNFYLESRHGNTKNLPINLLVWFDGNRLKYYTGFRIDAENWDKKKQEIKKGCQNKEGLQATYINTQLSDLKTKVGKIYQKDSNEPLSVKGFRNSLKEVDVEYKKRAIKKAIGVNTILFYFELYILQNKLSHGRIKQMNATFNHFRNFIKNDRDINSITYETIALFKKYLESDGTRGRNTVISNLKRLRSFFYYADDKEWIKVNPFRKFKIEAEIYGEPYCLSKDELELLYNYDLANNPRLEKVRDIFVFQCCIGCRVGDLLRLTKNNIVGDSILYVPTKTKEENAKAVKVPINDKARQILNKYNNEYTLLPFISDVKYNLYLKELFEVCELTRPVIRLNPKTGLEESVSLATIASTHLARRTFISILHKKVKDSVIASMTGHAEGSKAFSRYYSVDDHQKMEAVNQIL